MSILIDQSMALQITLAELLDERLRRGFTIHFSVPTRSMLPTLAPGDQLIVRGASAAEARVGDIVLVRQRDTLLAHRLIRVGIKSGELYLLTKGDNCSDADQPWVAAQLCGIADAVVHHSRLRNLRTNRAVWLNALLAYLSRAQWTLQRARPSIFRRSALRGSTMLLRVGTVLVRIVSG